MFTVSRLVWKFAFDGSRFNIVSSLPQNAKTKMGVPYLGKRVYRSTGTVSAQTELLNPLSKPEAISCLRFTTRETAFVDNIRK